MVTCPAFIPAADTLYAIPLETTVTVGVPVTIEVITGDPANPFQYMTGVRVTAPAASGFHYVPATFNNGSPGGAFDDVDGFWTAMGISAGNFLGPPDDWFIREEIDGDLYAYDFNVTPLGGSDVTSGDGALFNFQATFDTPGTYALGFEQSDIVDRTYYNDANQAPDYFWGDITNNHAGVPSSVTVE